jgi:hypothetical protein
MIKIIKVSMTVFIGFGLTVAQANQMNKYDVKSGKIEYELKGSGDIIGMVKIKSLGKKRVIFDDYGVKNLEEESEVKKETTMGKTKVEKNHTLIYMNGVILYKVDFKKKRINRMKNRGAQMAAMLGGEKNLKESGEAMMKKMGGKKLGTDKILGHTCTVWDLMGIKQCIYKGIPLKIESDIMGMKSLEIATKAEFDIDLDKDDFKLPDYPVYAFDMDRMMEGKELKKLDKSKLEEMDVRDNKKAKEAAGQAAKAVKAMGTGIEAAAKAGYNMKSGKEMTPLQEEAMKKAMMDAMGGEKAMLAKEKEEILKEAKNIPEAKMCFESANSVKEANACESMFDSEDPELHSKWNEKIKTNLLKELNAFEQSIDCIKSAESFNALRMCFPADMQ